MEKDKTNQGNKGQKGHINIHVFDKDPYIAFATSKSEKVAKAFYLITNFLDTREPLKWSLRELSLRLLQKVSSLAAVSLSEREKVILDISSIGGELLSLTGIAHTTGFLSDMNNTIMVRELSDLIKFLQEKHIGHYATLSRFDLTDGFFETTEPVAIKDSLKTVHPSISIRSNNVSDFNKQLQERLRKGQIPTGNGERRNKILSVARDLLKKQETFSIKDIVDHVTDCSEKTIQRELILLVKENVLLKEGERRWSRYSLQVA